MIEDAELLSRFVESGSNAHFTEFVSRHFNFVYHSALRRTDGRVDLARDVAQYVFTVVARRAADLCHHQRLGGWLYTTTGYVARTMLRAERRRLAREQEAMLMNDILSAEAEEQWPHVRKNLDAALDGLPSIEREAILLRFFDGQQFGQIGERLGLSEDAVRKRVERALEKLRTNLSKFGITSTSTALSAMLAQEAALAAPIGMAATVAEAALVTTADVALPATGILQFMAMKTTIGIAGALGLIGLLGITTGGAIYEINQARDARASLALAQSELQANTSRLAQVTADSKDAEQRARDAQDKLSQLQVANRARSQKIPPEGIGSNSRDPRSEAQRFLATVPSARAMLLENFKGVVQTFRPYFYRFANLTPAQIDAFENLEATSRLESLELKNGSWSAALPQTLPIDRIRQSLGEEVAQKSQDYWRLYWGFDTAAMVAEAVALVGAPLSYDQADRIAHAVADNNSDYRAGKRMTSANIKNGAQDWEATAAAAKGILSPEQWMAAERVFINKRFKQTFEMTAAAMTVGPIGTPKP